MGGTAGGGEEKIAVKTATGKIVYKRRLGIRIDMTPMVDIAFLLLIFYAVTTQFVTDERLKLKLPEAKTAEDAGMGREEAPPVVVVAAVAAANRTWSPCHARWSQSSPKPPIKST